MPIPDLDSAGFLPQGIFDCTLPEIELRFGRFETSDDRPRLFRQLLAYVSELRQWGIVRAVLVDGSFVTAKSKPNDIDLVLVLPDDFKMPVSLIPASYNSLSRNRVRRRWGFDLFLAREGGAELSKFVEFFQQVRHEPGRRKGLLRVSL